MTQINSGVPLPKVKVVPPTKVVGALNGFRGANFRVGSNVIKLDKKGLKHILERHHKDFWDGSVKASQTFFAKNMSINDVTRAIFSVLKQKRAEIIERGLHQGSGQIRAVVDGVEYVLGFKNGRIGQFFPVK